MRRAVPRTVPGACRRSGSEYCMGCRYTGGLDLAAAAGHPGGGAGAAATATADTAAHNGLKVRVRSRLGRHRMPLMHVYIGRSRSCRPTPD